MSLERIVLRGSRTEAEVKSIKRNKSTEHNPVAVLWWRKSYEEMRWSRDFMCIFALFCLMGLQNDPKMATFGNFGSVSAFKSPPPCRKLPNFPVWALSFLYWNSSQPQPLFVALATPPPSSPQRVWQQGRGAASTWRRLLLPLGLTDEPPALCTFTKAAPPSSQYSHRLTSPKTSSLSQNIEGSGKMSSSEFPVTGWRKCTI